VTTTIAVDLDTFIGLVNGLIFVVSSIFVYFHRMLAKTGHLAQCP